MRARLLLIPFIFSVPAYGQDIPSAAAAAPPGQEEYAPFRDLSQLPMDGGWTYGEVLDKAAAGDFRANMLAGEYWMGLYSPEPWRPAAGLPGTYAAFFP